MEKTENPGQNSQKNLKKVKQDCVFGTIFKIFWNKGKAMNSEEFSDNEYATNEL